MKTTFILLALFISVAYSVNFREILHLSCDGQVHLFENSFFPVRINFPNFSTMVNQNLQYLENRVKCGCPAISHNEFLTYFYIGTEALFNVFLGANGSSLACNISSIGLTGDTNLGLPSTCNSATWASTGMCFVELNLPDFDITVQIGLQKCATDSFPKVSVTCAGSGCDNILRPCTSDSQCGGGNLKCRQVATADDIWNALTSLNLYDNSDQKYGCYGVPLVIQDLNDFLNTQLGYPTFTSSVFNLCFVDTSIAPTALNCTSNSTGAPSNPTQQNCTYPGSRSLSAIRISPTCQCNSNSNFSYFCYDDNNFNGYHYRDNSTYGCCEECVTIVLSQPSCVENCESCNGGYIQCYNTSQSIFFYTGSFTYPVDSVQVPAFEICSYTGCIPFCRTVCSGTDFYSSTRTYRTCTGLLSWDGMLGNGVSTLDDTRVASFVPVPSVSSSISNNQATLFSFDCDGTLRLFDGYVFGAAASFPAASTWVNKYNDISTSIQVCRSSNRGSELNKGQYRVRYQPWQIDQLLYGLTTHPSYSLGVSMSDTYPFYNYNNDKAILPNTCTFDSYRTQGTCGVIYQGISRLLPQSDISIQASISRCPNNLNALPSILVKGIGKLCNALLASTCNTVPDCSNIDLSLTCTVVDDILNRFNATFNNAPGVIDPIWGKAFWGLNNNSYINTCQNQSDACCMSAGNYSYANQYLTKNTACVSTGNGVLDVTNLFRTISVPALGNLLTYVPNANKFCTPDIQNLVDNTANWWSGQVTTNSLDSTVSFVDLLPLTGLPSVLPPGNSDQTVGTPDTPIANASKNVPMIFFVIAALLFKLFAA